jgi:hypothetical protein
MRRNSVALAVLAMLLAGCGRAPSDEGAKAVDATNPLEVAARERGVVRAEAADLTGVFERVHELGRDAMCVVPDGAGRWRFSVTAAFGPGLACTAKGALMREGEGWRMRFAGADRCNILVREDEDELRLPGGLPPECDRVCPNRASLAGLRLPRASWSADDARHLQMIDKQGNKLASCGA